MAPSNEPPKEPDLFQKCFAHVGPEGFFGLAGLSGAAHYYFWHPFTLKSTNDFGRKLKSDLEKKVWKELMQTPGRGMNSPKARVCVVIGTTLVPWVFPIAWYASTCQRKVEEWERWQNKTPRTESAQTGFPSSAPGTLAAVNGPDRLQEDASSSWPVAAAEAGTEKPQLPEESGYAKFERHVARDGYRQYFLFCGALALLRVVPLLTGPPQFRARHQKEFRSGPATYILAACSALAIETSTIPLYVWWCRRSVAQRDLAALHASQQATESGPTGPQVAAVPDTGHSVDEVCSSTQRYKTGEVDSDWSWDDRASEQEKESRDAKPGGRGWW